LCAALAAASPLGEDRFREATGLPLVPYFSGTKLRWMLDADPVLRADALAGRAAFGTIDAWLAWRLSGGRLHVTDVTNASRTLLFNIHTLAWDDGLCTALGVPRAMLPRVVPSSGVLGPVAEPACLVGAPLAALFGDQHAALFGQAAFEPGEAKNTYGTGCFVLMNTGATAVHSRHRLLTTLAYQLDGAPPVYALEGSVAVTGSVVQWLRDGLRVIDHASESEALATSEADNGGVVFVPAFTGLFAPHWRADARGLIIGLTRRSTRGHVARAALEACAFQSHDVLRAMAADAGVPIARLKVDGGMSANRTLMQFQADVSGVEVVRPRVAETTALGAAYAAGLAVGFWRDLAELRAQWVSDEVWTPRMPREAVHALLRNWDRAVERSIGWLGAEGGDAPAAPAARSTREPTGRDADEALAPAPRVAWGTALAAALAGVVVGVALGANWARPRAA
jgi:glycerol kinase